MLQGLFFRYVWKNISTLFWGCDWEWICKDFWVVFWRPWPRFLASQWIFFGPSFGSFFFQNWPKVAAENGQNSCPESGHDFCPESGHRGEVDSLKTNEKLLFFNDFAIFGTSVLEYFWTRFLVKNLVHFLIQFWCRIASETSPPRAPNGRQIEKL